jgi:hypothetical protein
LTLGGRFPGYNSGNSRLPLCGISNARGEEWGLLRGFEHADVTHLRGSTSPRNLARLVPRNRRRRCNRNVRTSRRRDDSGALPVSGRTARTPWGQHSGEQRSRPSFSGFDVVPARGSGRRASPSESACLQAVGSTGRRF